MIKENSDTGYILPSVLLVSLLIETFLLGAIGLIVFYNKQTLKNINRKKLELACSSAVQEFIATESDSSYGHYSKIIDSIEVTVSYRFRGMFPEVTASAKSRRDSAALVCLLGNKMHYPFDNALIISRPDMNATVVGNTLITGDFLSATGTIKRGTIFGVKTDNPKFLYGQLKKDKEIKIKLFPDSLLRVRFERPPESFFSRTSKENYTLDAEKLNLLDSLDNLYISGDLLLKGNLYCKKNIISKKIYVHGRTIIEKNTFSNLSLEIFCDSSVTIQENCRVENLTVTALKQVSINKKSTLENVQVLSRMGVSVENSTLNYPSLVAFYVPPYDSARLKGKIELNSSTVNGTIMLVCALTGLSDNKSKITIDEASRVQGLIYSENRTELLGEVKGVVYTFNFWLYKYPTEYINWLVDVRINRSELSGWFLMPPEFYKKPDLEILNETWIY